jgi:hypothetical protein
MKQDDFKLPKCINELTMYHDALLRVNWFVKLPGVELQCLILAHSYGESRPSKKMNTTVAWKKKFYFHHNKNKFVPK